MQDTWSCLYSLWCLKDMVRVVKTDHQVLSIVNVVPAHGGQYMAP